MSAIKFQYEGKTWEITGEERNPKAGRFRQSVLGIPGIKTGGFATMPRGLAPKAQEELQKDWSDGELKEGVLPGIESVTFTRPDGASATLTAKEAQPHLPGLKPSLVDRLDATIKLLEEQKGVIGDRLRKAQAKHDEDDHLVNRELETARLARERALAAQAQEAFESTNAVWPAEPVDGTTHSLVKDGWRHVWTYTLAGGWKLAGSAPAKDIPATHTGKLVNPAEAVTE